MVLLKSSFPGDIREKFEYIRENEFFLKKNLLACLSGAQMGSIHEKIEV